MCIRDRPETAPAVVGPKNKKINKMTLAEIDSKLEKVKNTMGGFDSKYARQLIQRKKFLNLSK